MSGPINSYQPFANPPAVSYPIDTITSIPTVSQTQPTGYGYSPLNMSNPFVGMSNPFVGMTNTYNKLKENKSNFPIKSIGIVLLVIIISVVIMVIHGSNKELTAGSFFMYFFWFLLIFILCSGGLTFGYQKDDYITVASFSLSGALIINPLFYFLF